MKNLRKLLWKCSTMAVFAVAFTTIASTSRYLTYQPETDAELAEKYL